MSVQQVDRIDTMSMDRDGTFWLTMYEERPWDTITDDFAHLKKKVNFYLGAVRTGDLQAQVPEARNKPIGVRLMCATEPTPQALHILSLTKAGCHQFGYRFVVYHLNMATKESTELDVPMGEVAGINYIDPPAAKKKAWWKLW